jgi:hypothetical protein
MTMQAKTKIRFLMVPQVVASSYWLSSKGSAVGSLTDTCLGLLFLVYSVWLIFVVGGLVKQMEKEGVAKHQEILKDL